MTPLFFSCAILIGQAGIPSGSAKTAVETSCGVLEVYTYKPAGFRDGPMLVVLHGAGRNAEQHRDHAREAADRLGMLVVVPRFDEERFGSDRYHRGGLLRDREVAPRSAWTWNAVAQVVAEVRRREGRSALPCYLFGHSAGGQFLSRMAGFLPFDARRVVIANPSSYLVPSREVDYPYGFGGLPAALSGDDQIRRYLAQPLTIYVGTADSKNDLYLDEGPDAVRQGVSRYQRGRHVYAQAKAIARERGWAFGWRLVEARGVGHDHRGMLSAPEIALALFGPESVAAGKRPAPPGGE